MKNRLKIVPIVIILILIMQFLLPIVSRAADGTISVDLTRDENIVNITATDSSYNIVDMKYVNKYIEISDVSYFEENNSDVHTIDISPSRNVRASFEIDGYGTYTVYVRNSNGERYLSRITVHNPAEAPNLTLTKNEDNPLLLTIQATSANSEISILKIAKIDNVNENINFDTDGTNIEFAKSSDVSLVYKVDEEGLYAVYAKDENGASMTSQIYLSSNTTPININIKDLGNRKVNIKVTDDICNITKIKVAKASEISDFDDFETKGENVKFIEGRNVDVDYTLQEDGTYTFFVEDEVGYRRMVNERITEDGKDFAITITQEDKENPGNLTIRATDTVSNIVELKVAVGENINLKYFENNGESLQITPGKDVTVNYTVNQNCVLNVYVKDADGYSHMTSKTILGVDAPKPNQPPQITLKQNQTNPRQIDVTVSDIDSYNIETIKWAKGSQESGYFESNGTRIGQGIVGRIIDTEFTIDSIGTYTVFAEDEEGASTVKEINILSIDEVEEPDTTAPTISGVKNEGIYKNSVIPNVTDENLSSVTLTRNGTVVSNYQNGNTISEEGNYVLTAKDEAGNETKINFTIDLTAPEAEITQENTDDRNVIITINLTDNLSGVDVLKIASGEQNTNYFENGGQQINIRKNGNSAIGGINVTENGTYTAYIRDVAGNEKVQTFEVTTIKDEEPAPEPEPEPDTTAPNISLEKEILQDKKSVNLTINVVDTESQIKLVKMASGERDITYFENNGTELKMKKGDKTSTSIVNISENGTYTVYVEDEAGNKKIETVTVTEIEKQEPEPEPGDTTPPTITGVENGRTYRNYVTPTISDENLASVVLTRNGNVVEGYKNGDRISENGNYVLTAVDEAGNRTEVSFTINIEDDTNQNNTNTNTSGNANTGNTNTNTGNTNTNTNTGNNTNTNNNVGGNNNNTGVDNTNTNNNSNNNNNSQNASNTPSGSTNNGNGNGVTDGNNGTSGSVQNTQSSNMSSSRLPYTGTRNVIIIAIIALIGIATYCYIKYRKLS